MSDEREVDPVRVVDEDDERLAEEERDDREVVADETARRQADEEAEQRAAGDHDRNRELGRPVAAGVTRRKDSVHVCTEPEERDVAEIEQAGEADDDVQPEREQRVDQRDQPVTEQVPFRRDEREDRGRDYEHEQPAADGERIPHAAEATDDPAVTLALALDRRDPFVDADPRLIRVAVPA